MTRRQLLLNLPVYTATGVYIGRVVDVEIDSLSQQVVFYLVRTRLKLTGLWYKKILINSRQVIKILNTGIIVEDNYLPLELTQIKLVSELPN